MILAVADDITGAAEIAAVGRTFGLTAQIQQCEALHRIKPALGRVARSISSDLVVIDTDTRYRTSDPARDIEQALANYDSTLVEWYYKKVDSVLRGNVAEELCAMMQYLQKNRAILAPANPTKARVISNGQYFINGQPLHKTDFANDPEYPAVSSKVMELLKMPRSCPLHVRTYKTYNGDENGIIVAEAENMDDLVQWSKHVDEHTLAAGGSDFFRVMLEKKLPSSKALSEINIAAVSGKKLFVCGSTSQTLRKAVAQASNLGIPVCPMPDILFKNTLADDTLIEQWADDVLKALPTSGRVIIAILQPVVNDSRMAQNLRITMAAVVQKVLSSAKINELFIEGGSTAEAVLHELEWQTFDVIGQYAPGVVQMRVPQRSDNYVTIKPGSYPWPDRIWI
jgi:uncharacterized protein YgbK (DUF1537 family)